MSAAKRSRPRPSDAQSAASKRQKISSTSHAVPVKSNLRFLIDEDARASKKLEAKLTNGVPGVGINREDESRTILAANTEEDDEDDEEDNDDDDGVDDIRPNGAAHKLDDGSSDDEVGSDDDEEEEEFDAEGVETKEQREGYLTNGHSASMDDGDEEEAGLGAGDERVHDHEPDDAQSDGEDSGEAEAAEPSFGELQQSREMQTVNVHASLTQAEPNQSVIAQSSRVVAGPSNTSLSTVLTQALRTNDKALLESCFQVSDLPSVRSTIERLQPQHAAALLQRLAERIYKAPGRTGNIMVWVQWTLVTHGGYLATQPRVMVQLKALGRVVRERASGLQPLLHLKGKLDLLSAQLEYRQKMQASARAVHAEEEDDERAVEYIEGRDNDDWSEDEEEDGVVENDADLKMLDSPVIQPKVQVHAPRTGDEKANHNHAEGDGGDIFTLPNGAIQEEEEDDDDDEDDDEEGLFDDEAEEASEDDKDDEPDSDEEAESQPESEDDGEEEGASEDEDKRGGKGPHPSKLNRRR